MVLGLKSKTHKSPSVKVEYIIHIDEVKPWPPSQSLSTLRAALIQWEHGDRASGFTNQVVPSFETGSGVGDGRIEFNESFRLRLTLMREMSVKAGDEDTYQRNCIEFNLYEPRRDRGGQLLGTAVLDLAACGVIKENVSITTPIICKRTYRNSPQPLLFLKIQPVEERSGSFRSHGESVSALMSEEYAEEAEVASSNTDDDGSSHSSLPVSSSAADSNGSSSPFSKKHQMGEEEINKEKVTSHKREVKIQLSSEESILSSSSSSKEFIGERNHKMDKHLSSGFKQLQDDNKAPSPSVEIHEKYVEEEGLEVENSLESGKSTRRNHSLATDTSRGSISGDLRKEAKTPRKGTRNLVSEGRIQNLEQRIKILEGELREAAALEVSLYSVAAEHGSSMNKVHAPARRLSRLYIHANKQNPKSGRANASKTVVSGLILVSKACGNDVPRLTFWLSNTIILRAIISKTFGDGQLPNGVKHDIRNAHGKKKSSPLTRGANGDTAGEREKPLAFIAALEKVEAWIFSRIIESLWWQTFTPHMQSGAAKAIRRNTNSDTRKSCRRKSSSTEQQQGNFSLELWKKAFKDACERICPVRGGGHDCGCLPSLSKLIMEQLVARLDVAMFNAILRESADEIPTDPVADPISDANVLPIPAGKASFGAGAQLKNTIGNWSRWLTDLFGMDDEDDDVLENENSSETGDDKELRSSKVFCLLNSLSDLMMLPKDLLLSPSIRKEVCPTFGPPLLRRILNSFVPDEFCPDPIPGVVLEALNSEDYFDSKEDSIVNLPSEAAAVVYQSPSADSVASIIGGIGGGPKLARSGSSLLKKSQTSDDELDQLDSPLKAFILESSQSSLPNDSRSPSTSVRYQLLRLVWKE